MPALAPVSHADLVRRLRTLGFTGPFPGGKHLYMIRGDVRLAIPNPHGQSISVGLLTRILRQAGIDRDDWAGSA